MRRRVSLAALLIALTAASDAGAQPLTLKYQQVVTRAVPDATAAFALDPSLVGASAHDGVVTLVGRGPGTTNVVVIAADRTISLAVVVSDPPVTLLPGFRLDTAGGATAGYYEARYGSDPGIIQSNLFLSRREGARSAELTLGGAAPVGDRAGSRLSVPMASFTLRGPDHEVTLLDRVISNSPLTISQANIRGLYVRDGAWQVNAGYSFFSTFEHLLLPTDKQAVVGIAYRRQLSQGSSLTPNFYYFGDNASGGRSGGVGTLFYDARPTASVKVDAELAVSRTAGGAADIVFDRPGARGWAKLRVAPRDLPSLPTDHQSGQQFDGGWQSSGSTTTFSATMSSQRYEIGTIERASTVANLDLQRQLGTRWGVHGGTGLSRFDGGSPSAPPIQSLTLPLGASYSRHNAGLGFDYQFSRETERNLGGLLFRANASASGHGFRLSLFGERQTQAPTARQIFTDAPWLQPMLDRLGLAANTPQQLADLVRTNAQLSAYGYLSDVQIDVTPVRVRGGATIGWTGSGPRRPALTVSTLLNRDQSITQTSLGAVHTLGYSQRVDRSTDLFVSLSTLCQDRLSTSCHPVMFASLRRALTNGPGLLRTRRGNIDGIVFRDDEGLGAYTANQVPLANVDIVLDDGPHTQTDGSGRFRFEDVPAGRHRVEARYTSGVPTFFTTPSPADVDSGGSVEFGIALSRSSLRGVVRTDAGAGLSGVVLQIAGADRRTSARTDDDGAFVAEGIAPGDYDVSIEAGSVPVGYPLTGLAAQHVRVAPAAAGRVTFVLRPYRTLSGHARVFDRATGRYVALAGATVELQPLQQQSVTDASGQFAFRDLPAGSYTVVARHDGHEQRSPVNVPDGPVFVKDVDVALVPAAVTVAGAAAVTHHDERRVEPAGEQFTVEIADSSSIRYVRAMVTELKDGGHAAYVVAPAVAGRGSYHVRVGVYSTRAEADRSARSLEKTLGWRLSVTSVATASSIVATGDPVSDSR